MTDREVLEQIDACRPASDDMMQMNDGRLRQRLQSDPVAREAYDRIQSLDGTLQMAIHEVATPDGLESRLLARLGCVSSTTPTGDPAAVGYATDEPLAAEAGDAPNPATPAESPIPIAHPQTTRFARRLWLSVGGAAIAASVVWLIVVPGQVDSWPTSTDQLLSDSVQVFSSTEPSTGRALNNDPMLATFPISSDVVPGRATTWRPLIDFHGHDGVAYDLAPRRGADATLYVFRHANAALPAAPALPNAVHETGGFWATAWKIDDLVYVLVVQPGPTSPDAGKLFLRTSTPV